MKNNILYKILRPLFVLWFRVIYKPKIIKYSSIPKKGPVIIVSNHFNNFDFISMGLTTKRSICFLAKHGLFKGLLKPILLLCGIIPVNREIKDKSVINRSKKVLEKNKIIGLFPEGTFNKSEKNILPFKIGAVKLSYETKTPIIPVAIVGQYKKNKLKIIIGKEFMVLSEDLDSENKKLMNIVEQLIKRNEEV